HGSYQLFGSRAQDGKRALASRAQLRTRFEREAGLEHGRVIGRLLAGKPQIGLAEPFKGRKSVGLSPVPGRHEYSLEQIEAAPRHIDQKLVAVAEMPVGRRRAHSGKARSLGEGEARGAFFGNELERGAH